MAFIKGSRYEGVETVTAEVAGRSVTAVKLRLLPRPAARPLTVETQDRLDTLAQREYDDGTRFWYIADANSELEAAQLIVTSRIIQVPE